VPPLSSKWPLALSNGWAGLIGGDGRGRGLRRPAVDDRAANGAADALGSLFPLGDRHLPRLARGLFEHSSQSLISSPPV